MALKTQMFVNNYYTRIKRKIFHIEMGFFSVYLNKEQPMAKSKKLCWFPNLGCKSKKLKEHVPEKNIQKD